MVLEQFIIDADIIWDQVGKTFFENPEAKPGRIMRVQVVNAGIIEDLTGYTLNLGWTSVRDPSKFGLDAFDDVDITKGIFEIEYTSGMLTNIGPLNASLQLVPPGEGRPIESNNFKLTVKNSAINPEAIQGETSFKALENALVEVNGWNTRIDLVEQEFKDRADALDGTYPVRLTAAEQSVAAVEAQVDLLNRGLGETMPTMASLLAAYPTGDTRDHIVAGNIAEVDTLTVTAIPTVASTITITLNGVAKTVTVDPAVQTTTALVATLIRGTTFTGWTTGGTGSVVTFTAATTGARAVPTFAGGTTGVTATFAITTKGENANFHRYFWNGTAWTDGGIYQAFELTDNSVQKKHVEGISVIPSKNLFDKATMLQTNSIDNVGTITYHAGWDGAKIPVAPLQTYSFKLSDGVYYENGVGRLAYMDANSSVLSSVNMATFADSSSGGGKQFTTPLNTAYVFMNAKVLDHNYIDTLQLELGTAVTEYTPYTTQVITKLFGNSLADISAREDLTALDTERVVPLESFKSKIESDLYSNANDNSNYGLATVVSTDWYIGSGSLGITAIEPCTNSYLNSLGIENWLHLDVGEFYNDNTLKRRDVFYRLKYPEVIKGKYFQVAFYMYSETGTPASFSLNTTFAAIAGGAFTQVSNSEVVVTAVEGQANLWKIRKSGIIPTDKDYVELWIGSSFGSVIATTPDMSLGGFYGKVGTEDMLGADAFYTSPPNVPPIIKLDSEVVELTNRVEGLEATIGTATTQTIPKNLVIMGDSITADPTWWTANMLQRLAFSNYLNLARSGATWSHTAGTVYDIVSTGGSTTSENVIWNQINKLIDRVTRGVNPIPEVVVILSGTNDYSRTQGVASTEFAGASPITGQAPGTILNIAKAIRYCCELLLTTYPDVQIILVTPIQRGSDDNATIFNIGQVIKDCADYLSVTAIDAGKRSGIYGKYDSGTTHKYLYDNLHPTPLGNEKYGSFMANELKQVIVV